MSKNNPIELSDGFKETIADIIGYCYGENTDSVALELETNGIIVEIKMSFGFREVGEVVPQ